MQLPSENGHRKTAFNWIKQNNLMNVYINVLGTNNIYDEEDFLMEYIGAIKLYAYCGELYCWVPKIPDINKNFFRDYYEKLGYKIIGNNICDLEKTKVKILKNEYNRTIMKKNNNQYIYNPLKDGD